MSGTSHPRIMTVNEMPIKLKDMRILIERLIKLSKEENLDELIKYLIQIADYTPNDIKVSETFKSKSFRKQKTYEANVIPLSLIKNKKNS